MRRLLLILIPILLLGLAACGGTQGGGTPTGPATGGAEQVLAAAAGGSGSASTEVPPALEVPANAVQSFTLEGPTQTATNGRTTVAGKIVNNGTTAATPTLVIVALLDESGKVVSQSSFSDPRFTVIEPGASVDWQGEVRFSVAANQRLSITVEGVSGAAGQ